MRKSKILLVILTIVAILVTGFAMSVEATTNQSTEESKVELYAKEDLPVLLTCAEINVETKHVYYKYNGVEYPAYCLNENLEGVSADKSYSVDITNEITDVDIKGNNVTALGLWRVIVNGYPYKTIEELGCKNEQEAYKATQTAIYCYLSNTPLSLYRENGIGGYDEAAVRTLEALKNIITNADNSKEMPDKSNKVFFGKAPSEELQNYALTGIVEKEEPVKAETIKLPVTGM